jgi:2-polyprenyl-3-methyl-5-hydroxy-6-metoxy-1,4-benzoquinol methylase
VISASILKSEREFFDQEAARLGDESMIIPEKEIVRYSQPREKPGITPKEFLFLQMGSLVEKHVLDYGCGDGENSILLASCGARVTAFDLSPASIARAKRRADAHGLASRIDFEVRTAGETGYSPRVFDIVCGFNILHHVHQDLPAIFKEIATVLKPTGSAYFIEPVMESRLLRILRQLVPVQREATNDERQLTSLDFALLSKEFNSVKIRHFYFLERLHRVLGVRIGSAFRAMDHYALRLCPLLRSYYGIVVVNAKHCVQELS